MDPVDVTIYEYTDREKWITNGRSITLRIPIAYLTFSAALSGGAQSVISIDFDYDTKEPWTREHAAVRARTEGDASGSTDGSPGPVRTARMSANLSIFDRPFDKRQSDGLTAAKSGNPDWFYKDYVYLDDSICGYDMFRDDNVHGVRHSSPPRYPFDEATVFARTSSSGYDTMVECTWLGERAWCGATRTFDGFPLTIHFDGDRLCEVDAAFARATGVLDGFVIERTAPVEGWGAK